MAKQVYSLFFTQNHGKLLCALPRHWSYRLDVFKHLHVLLLRVHCFSLSFLRSSSYKENATEFAFLSGLQCLQWDHFVSHPLVFPSVVTHLVYTITSSIDRSFSNFVQVFFITHRYVLIWKNVITLRSRSNWMIFLFNNVRILSSASMDRSPKFTQIFLIT